MGTRGIPNRKSFQKEYLLLSEAIRISIEQGEDMFSRFVRTGKEDTDSARGREMLASAEIGE